MARLWAFLVPLLLIVAADRLSKVWVRATIWEPPRTVVVVPGWLELTPVANRGIAFGLLQDTGGWLALLAVAVLGAVAIQRRHEILQAPFIVRTPLGLIGGGAIGNILDRVQLGYVPDFIRVPRIGLFQVFNISDAAIVVGTAVLVVALWFIEQQAPKKLAEAPAPTEEPAAPPPDETPSPSGRGWG